MVNVYKRRITQTIESGTVYKNRSDNYLIYMIEDSKKFKLPQYVWVHEEEIEQYQEKLDEIFKGLNSALSVDDESDSFRELKIRRLKIKEKFNLVELDKKDIVTDLLEPAPTGKVKLIEDESDL